MTQNIQNGFFIKIENGFKNTENYRCNQVGDSSWMGEDKNCQTWGGTSSYPPLIILNGGGRFAKICSEGGPTG